MYREPHAFLEVHDVCGDRVDIVVSPIRGRWRARVRSGDGEYDVVLPTFDLAESAAQTHFEFDFPAHFCTGRCRRFRP